MEKYTQRQLKDLVNNGVAVDVSRASSRDIIPEHYTQIGYVSGTYGCSGMLLKGLDTNNLYAITGRTQAIYIF